MNAAFLFGLWSGGAIATGSCLLIGVLVGGSMPGFGKFLLVCLFWPFSLLAVFLRNL